MTTYLGVDIGSEAIHVCAADPKTPPPSWRVTKIELKGDWTAELESLAQPPALAVLEPTGWHYALPIANTLQHAGAAILYTSNFAAARARELHISQHKTDVNDARALAVIAKMHGDGQALRITRHFFTRTTELATELRLTFAMRERATKQRTQAINRLTQILHGVWPALASSKDLWLKRLADPPALSHADLIAARDQAIADGLHHSTIHAINRLTQAVPDWLPVTEPQYRAATMLSQEYQRTTQTIENLEDRIESLIWDDAIADITGLWYTIPGAGVTHIAALHVATYCRAAEFSADEFRAAVGCHPIRQESGLITNSRSTKTGYRPAKKALHLWTLRLIAHKENPIAEYFYEQQRRGKTQAIHSTRGKLARVLSGIARKGVPCNW